MGVGGVQRGLTVRYTGCTKREQKDRGVIKPFSKFVRIVQVFTRSGQLDSRINLKLFTKGRIVVSSVIDIRHVTVVVVALRFRGRETGVVVVGTVSIHGVAVSNDSSRCNPLAAIIPLLRFGPVAQR